MKFLRKMCARGLLFPPKPLHQLSDKLSLMLVFMFVCVCVCVCMHVFMRACVHVKVHVLVCFRCVCSLLLYCVQLQHSEDNTFSACSVILVFRNPSNTDRICNVPV